MRKLMLILLVAVMTAPAMAEVEITVSDNGDCTFDIGYVCTDDDAAGDKALMAGLAIVVSVDAGTIDAVDPAIDGESTAAAPGYGVFMKTAQIDMTDPENPVWVTGQDPVATPGDPGTVGGIGEDQITLQLGALYDDASEDMANAPLASGTLCTVTVSDDALVTVTLENTARGGIVMEGGGEPSGVVVLATDVAVTGCGPGCEGDFDGNEIVNSSDISVIVNWWLANKNFFGNAPDHPDYDVNCDDQVNSSDISVVVNYWLTNKNFFGYVTCPGPGFVPTCP